MAKTNDCPNCAPYDCYHICPNSPHYYSPEQERQDDANHDPSEYFRESGFEDPEPSVYEDPEFHGEPAPPLFEAIALIVVDVSDDLPF